jgi:hypothetical protein
MPTKLCNLEREGIVGDAYTATMLSLFMSTYLTSQTFDSII